MVLAPGVRGQTLLLALFGLVFVIVGIVLAVRRPGEGTSKSARSEL